jgi:hypothetical protein
MRKIPNEIIEAGIEALIVVPIFKPKYKLAPHNKIAKITPIIIALRVNSSDVFATCITGFPVKNKDQKTRPDEFSGGE